MFMKKTSIGGQALIEGLMMIGPKNAAIAIRKADGEIIVEKRDLPKMIVGSKMPFVRGTVNFLRQMILGIKAMMYSAQFMEVSEEEQSEKPSKIDMILKKILGQKIYDKLTGADGMSDFMIYGSLMIALVFNVVVFMLLPNFLAELMNFKKTESGDVLYNLFEGVVRVSIFFVYMVLVSKMNDIKRVWQYHGAEHKTIHCYEKGDELTVENIKKCSTKHPRCGTSFLLLVMLVSVLVFSLLPRINIFANIGMRIMCLPVVAGLSYEFLKFAGRKSEWAIMRAINVPGLLFQYFTTNEPDDSQIEVAIEAMKNVLPEEKDADLW